MAKRSLEGESLPSKKQRPDEKVSDKTIETSESVETSSETKKKPIRVWCDGCFDLCHWGHANALRQAKALGDILVVGVHSDAEIRKHKGPPVMDEKERYEMVRSIKWVDEVVEAAPYVTTLETLIKHDIDFCVHGEDISTDADGRDSFWEVKQANKFRLIKRSEGVSTTDLVGRMILLSKNHFAKGSLAPELQVQAKEIACDPISGHHTTLSEFLPTTRRVALFTDPKQPKEDDKIVYVYGGFDLLHTGHISILKQAKALGTYLIVGIHDDLVVNKIKGLNLPIMNLHERVLSVLACRYVDEVIMGSPWSPTKEQLKGLNVSIVVKGVVSDHPQTAPDPYAAAKELGIFREIESGSKLTTKAIIDHIIQHRLLYEERNQKKLQKEAKQPSTTKKSTSHSPPSSPASSSSNRTPTSCSSSSPLSTQTPKESTTAV